MAGSKPPRLVKIDTTLNTFTPQGRGEDKCIPLFAAPTPRRDGPYRMRMTQGSRAK